jgi:hypothetical protein
VEEVVESRFGEVTGPAMVVSKRADAAAGQVDLPAQTGRGEILIDGGVVGFEPIRALELVV